LFDFVDEVSLRAFLEVFFLDFFAFPSLPMFSLMSFSLSELEASSDEEVTQFFLST
jgi:hypothetical protein